ERERPIADRHYCIGLICKCRLVTRREFLSPVDEDMVLRRQRLGRRRRPGKDELLLEQAQSARSCDFGQVEERTLNA
ncbi:hypothetical protein ABTP64_18670, partial [Acinetobacter baumannii]